MKTGDMRESKFLKQSDVGRGALLTISGIVQHNVAKDGADPELKYCMTFLESEKPLVANSTNLQLCEHIFGSDETDDWIGKKIVLYADPNVSYGGKLVGGIRVRAPRLQAQPQVAPRITKPLPVADLTDDLEDPPF